jgi:hypothetical protein
MLMNIHFIHILHTTHTNQNPKKKQESINFKTLFSKKNQDASFIQSLPI